MSLIKYSLKFSLPLLLLLGITACKNPSRHNERISLSHEQHEDQEEAVVFYAALADTIPSKIMNRLALNQITGIKIKGLQGGEICYFGYYAEEKKLLTAIASLPFIKNAAISDTLCRSISFEDMLASLQPISAFEQEQAPFFWGVDPQEFNIYECIKSPLKHTFLINDKSGLVLHRIEKLSIKV